MKNFKKLKVWEKAWQIAIDVYRFSDTLERQQTFTFSSQITRAALSIPSNIAEGSSKRSEKDYYRFLEFSLGSAFELETQLDIMKELEIGDTDIIKNIMDEVNEIQRMLYGLMNSLSKANGVLATDG